jgi:hypothetical protein
MLKNSVFLLLGALFYLTNTAHSQSIFLNFKDGTKMSYNLNEVRNFSFRSDSMNIKKTNGEDVSWDVSKIANFRYTETITSITQVTLNTAEVKIFPNPSRGAVRIRYQLLAPEKVGIDIFDMQGRNIRSWPLSQKTAGTYEILWQTSDAGGKAVPAGTYICRVTTSKGTISKMMILE